MLCRLSIAALFAAALLPQGAAARGIVTRQEAYPPQQSDPTAGMTPAQRDKWCREHPGRCQ